MSRFEIVDGKYQVPIVDLGKQLENLGLTVVEHSAFGGTSNVHAKNSFHDYDEAIDIQDWRPDMLGGVHWKDRTANLAKLLQGSGKEVLGPGTPGHDSHVHLGNYGGVFSLSPEQYTAIFEGSKTSTFSPGSFETSTSDTSVPEASSTFTGMQGPVKAQIDAKERAQSYAEMSKADINTQYDKLRESDPSAARIEGMKMHKAFFNK